MRMVTNFMLATLCPWIKDDSGVLLVLGCTHVSEGLRGYITKYDASSADLNPIGGLNKSRIFEFAKWFSAETGINVLAEIAADKPAAELTPLDP